jgi:hypothetical protein
MLRRLGLGFLKGLIVGAGVGAAFQLGLAWTLPGLAGYLAAMGTGATAGVLAGRPPWKHDAWIESLLKAVAGLGVGALVYWLTSYVDAPIPLDLPGAIAGTPWRAVPLVALPLVGAVFGTLVELDNVDGGADAATKKMGKATTRTRVAIDDLEDGDEVAPPARAGKKRA